MSSPNPGISAAGEAAGRTALNPATGPAAIGGMLSPGESEPEPDHLFTTRCDQPWRTGSRPWSRTSRDWRRQWVRSLLPCTPKSPPLPRGPGSVPAEAGTPPAEVIRVPPTAARRSRRTAWGRPALRQPASVVTRVSRSPRPTRTAKLPAATAPDHVGCRHPVRPPRQIVGLVSILPSVMARRCVMTQRSSTTPYSSM